MRREYEKRVNKYTDKLKTGDMILDIQTSTRFWRTSMLLRADLIIAEEDTVHKISMISEKESDEYDILIELAARIRESECIYSFNGKSFDIPHLIKKYNAYRMQCALGEKRHVDLMLELRKYDPLLALPSHRLADYYALAAGKAQSCTDAEATYAIIPLLDLERFVSGRFEIISCSSDYTGEKACFELACDLPCPVRYSSDYFTVNGELQRAEITAGIETGNLRLYHEDYHSYVFLPIEGYSVHKSVASYIAASRKTAADREHCYTYIPFNAGFIGNADKMSKYLISVLRHCAG